MKPELERQLREAFPQLTDEDFDYHATDLYVRARPDVVKWLVNNYQFWKNITRFRCPVSDPELNAIGVRELWLDIPFAGYWPGDQRTPKEKHEHNREDP